MTVVLVVYIDCMCMYITQSIRYLYTSIVNRCIWYSYLIITTDHVYTCILAFVIHKARMIIYN